MARIRSIHPDICVSQTMALLSSSVERTFTRLLTHCDDAGRCIDNTKLLKGALFSLHDDVSPETLDEELELMFAAGLIVRYEVDGACFISVCSWDEYQHPQRPKGSKFPEPSATNTRSVRDASAIARVEVVVGGEGRGAGDELDGRVAEPPADSLVAQFNARRWATTVTAHEPLDALALLRLEGVPDELIAAALPTCNGFPSNVINRAHALHQEQHPQPQKPESRTAQAPGPRPECDRCDSVGFIEADGAWTECPECHPSARARAAS